MQRILINMGECKLVDNVFLFHKHGFVYYAPQSEHYLQKVTIFYRMFSCDSCQHGNNIFLVIYIFVG